jgi:hypothetical protein
MVTGKLVKEIHSSTVGVQQQCRMWQQCADKVLCCGHQGGRRQGYKLLLLLLLLLGVQQMYLPAKSHASAFIQSQQHSHRIHTMAIYFQHPS